MLRGWLWAVLAAVGFSGLAVSITRTDTGDDLLIMRPSLADLLQDSSAIILVDVERVDDSRLRAHIVDVLKGRWRGKQLVVRDRRWQLTGSWTYRAMSPGMRGLPALLFILGARGRGEGEEATAPTDQPDGLKAFLAMDQTWWTLRKQAGEGAWAVEQFIPEMGYNWQGSVEMLRECMRQGVAAGMKTDFPVRAILKWHAPIQVWPGDGAVHDAIPVDLTGDGHVRVFLLSRTADRVVEYEKGRERFREVTKRFGVASKSDCAAFLDADGDARLDLVSLSGQHMDLWLQGEDGRLDKGKRSLRAPVGFLESLTERPLGIDVVSDGKGLRSIVVSRDDVPALCYVNEHGEFVMRDAVALPVGRSLLAAEVPLAVRFGPPPGGKRGGEVPLLEERGDAALKARFEDWARGFGDTRRCVTADFDGDGRPDILQPYERGALLYEGAKEGGFKEPRSCAVSKRELRAVSYVGRDGSRLRALQPLGTLYAGRGPAKTLIMDIDGDGNLDPVFLARAGGLWIWRNRGGEFDGPFSPGQPHGWHYQPYSGGAVGDLNLDGRQDILAVSRSRVKGGLGGGRERWWHPELYLNRGFGHLMIDGSIGFPRMDGSMRGPLGAIRGEGEQQPQKAAVLLDLNQDGAHDILLVLEDGSVWAILQDIGGKPVFSVSVALPVGGPFSGPLRVVGWADGRCLGARNVVAGMSDGFFGRDSAGTVMLKWQFPGQNVQTAQVEANTGPVRVILGPAGIIKSDAVKSSTRGAAPRQRSKRTGLRDLGGGA